MADINLLPTELKASKEVVRTAQTLTRITIIFAVMLLFISIIGGAILYFQSQRAAKLEAEQQTLLTTINSLKGTEQRLVLLKDRIAKVNQVLGAREKYKILDKYDGFVTTMPTDTSLKDLELDASIAQIILGVSSSTDVVSIMDRLKESDTFSLVYLVNLEFNPLSGYELTLDLQ